MGQMTQRGQLMSGSKIYFSNVFFPLLVVWFHFGVRCGGMWILCLQILWVSRLWGSGGRDRPTTTMEVKRELLNRRHGFFCVVAIIWQNQTRSNMGEAISNCIPKHDSKIGLVGENRDLGMMCTYPIRKREQSCNSNFLSSSSTRLSCCLVHSWMGNRII